MTNVAHTASWPRSHKYAARFLVPDLSPEQRPQLADFKPELVFVAESPHVSEIEPELLAARRPLCGKAGQAFWGMVGELLGQGRSAATDLERLLELCRQGHFAVMNAVQFPLDPKVMVKFPEADPVAGLGFSKVPPASFKKLRDTEAVEKAVDALRARLSHPNVASAAVVSLGNDSQWFITRALGAGPGEGRHLLTIPHPSAWWRQGGKLREKAREGLGRLFIQDESSVRAGLRRSHSGHADRP